MDLYGLWMTCRLGEATGRISELFSHYESAEEIYQADPSEAARLAGLGKQAEAALANRELDDVRRLMELCRNKGIEALHPWQEGYPELLKQIKAPPFTLFYRGNPEIVQSRLCIAIVGTRSCTRYGASVAEKLAGDLAACGVTVISGMAEGIDSCANLGALKAEGKTVAVLGNGLDQAYPAHNGFLMEQILETGGLTLSEYPPNSPIQRSNFPARNRIISGLSQGVVIVEAPKKSGALITARFALEQDRDLFTVPGNITSYTSEGTNQLLKESCAKPVTETLDILEEYLAGYGHLLQIQDKPSDWKRPAETRHSDRGERQLPAGSIPRPEPKRPSEFPVEPQGKRAARELRLSGEERTLLELLKGEVKSADRLVQESGLPVSKAMAALTMLEAKGYILSRPGAKFESNFHL